MVNNEFIPKFKKPIYNHNDLFRPGSDFELNACVGNNGGPYDFQDYAIGYFDSGERLFRSIEKNFSNLDVLVYPLVYVYRHAVELGLKHLMQVLPKLFEETEEIRFTHNLDDNWGIVRSYLKRIEKKFYSYFNENDTSINETIDCVNRSILDLISIDRNGQSFRFPALRSGENSLHKISHINIRVFYEAMKEMEKCFEYWFAILGLIWDDYKEYRYYLQEE